MSPSSRASLLDFAPWLRQTDDHAQARLELLQQAEAAMVEPVPADRAVRSLAARLERWRYQILNRSAPPPAAEDRAFADALDLAANHLARRAPRHPRAVRAAIEDPAADPPAIEQAIACLDPHRSLGEIVRRAIDLTQEHFGAAAPDRSAPSAAAAHWRVLLYAPIYLSNYCTNHCRYCGFRFPNAIPRKHLTLDEALGEAELLTHRGFEHLLLVAGDYPRLTSTEYFTTILRALVDRGVAPAVEIAPQSTDDYQALVQAGACGVTLYQETYNPSLYALYHPRGSKANFDWRLEGLDRAAEAGMLRLGLGFLLGLADPREELLAMLRHAHYLARRFPDRTLAFSLPRIRQAPSGFQAPFPVDDETFVRLYCALRTAFPRAELVLSTRELAPLRDRLAAICITQLSAGSCTSPGGYEAKNLSQIHQEDLPRPSDSGTARGFRTGSQTAALAGEQFPVCDHREPAEVVESLRRTGLQPVWRLSSAEGEKGHA